MSCVVYLTGEWICWGFTAHLDICNVIQALESGRYELGGCLNGRNECIYSYVYGVVYAGLECFNNVKKNPLMLCGQKLKILARSHKSLGLRVSAPDTYADLTFCRG